MTTTPNNGNKPAGQEKPFQTHFFSELLGRRVSETRRTFRLGKLTDLVFKLADPYPEAVGIFIDHGWGKPTELIPWERVVRIDLPCAPCMKPRCAYVKPLECLRAISPVLVLDAVQQRLACI